MRCPACTHENPEGDRYCGGCGAALERVCPSCDHANPPTHRFCGGCGGPLEPPAPAPREPRAYTPKHLAERILRARSALEGERKQVTVLFADVKGSTELADELDPEDWHAILDRFLQILTEGVHRFEGTVNQYTGDGIMALFGAPIAHEDHAQRACYAALNLRDALRGYADELRRDRGLSFSARLGLNSGEVVVGKIGDDLRMDYTAQGAVVNVAQRMEQLAEPGRAYLTRATAERVTGYFQLRELGPSRVKGVRDPVGVFELEDTGEFQSRFDVSRSRGLSQFVGREEEMAVLEAALERARQGVGQVVGIVAEAGTGKSRLTHEFAERCRAAGLDVAATVCPPHGREEPLGVAMGLQRSLAGIEEGDGAETARNKIAAGLSRRDPSLVEFMPFLMEFHGVAEPGTEALFTDPDARQRELLRFLATVVGLGRDDVFLTIIEDVHWQDEASRAMTAEMQRLQQDKRYLTIKNFRPEYVPPERGSPNYVEIRLEPLNAESTERLLRSLLGPDASDPDLEALIQARAAGNPFYVEEIVQTLAESGHLEGERGAYRLARAVDAIDVPSTVAAVLAARIDRLDEEAKEVLHTAAVIGREFPVPVLAELCTANAELDATLSRLVAAEYLYQQSAYPEIEYAFKHPLTQQVAYETQLREHRRRVHGAVARVLEGRYREALDEKSALLAYHLTRADRTREAAHWSARAATWLESRDPREAVEHWRNVCARLPALPDVAHDAALALQARDRVLHLGIQGGLEDGEDERLLAEGRTLAARLDDPAAEASLIGRYIFLKAMGGEWSAREEAGRTLELLQGLEPVGEVAASASMAMLRMGRVADGLALLDEALENTGDRDGSDVGSQRVKAFRSTMLLELGRLTEGMAEADALLRDAPEDDPFLLFNALLRHGAAAVRIGRPVAQPERIIELAREARLPVMVVQGYLVVATSRLLEGRWHEALAAAEEGLRQVQSSRASAYATTTFTVLQRQAHAGLGDLSRAVELAEQAALQDAPVLRGGVRAPLALAHMLCARGRLADADRVESLIERAAADLAATQACLQEPEVLEARAALCRLRDDEPGRVRALQDARRRYLKMGATGHEERVAATLAPPD